MRFAMVSMVAVVALCLAIASSVRAEEVDLELVLAMDGSGSISESEYVLQLEGTARAFGDPSIQQAIFSGPTGRIAVSVMIWSDAAFPKVNTGWFLLDTPESANAFAAVVRSFHKHTGRKFGIGGGGTGIGAGVAEALKMISGNQYEGLRKVVDVSGDGVETDPWFQKSILVHEAKQIADAQGVMVNGLPILTADFPRLDEYYRQEVITGPGSFIVVADDFNDFGRAIREKLRREISASIALARPPNGERVQ